MSAAGRAKRTRRDELERGENVAAYALELRPEVVLMGGSRGAGGAALGRWHLLSRSGLTACGVPTVNAHEHGHYDAERARRFCGNCSRMLRVVLLEMDRAAELRELEALVPKRGQA